jgi:predicted metal-dependent hydrolase
MEEVLSKVEARARWIVKQRRYFEQFLPKLPPRRYVSGETFLYLGRQYRLKIIPGIHKTTLLRGQFLEVHGPKRTDRRAIRNLVDAWYRAHAKAAFDRRLMRCWESARRHGIARPALRIRRMTRRWGSCGSKGTVLLNTELVRAPVHCIDYVIMHEICHLRWPHHHASFYRLLSLLMPDWKSRKKRLEQVLIPDI